MTSDKKSNPGQEANSGANQSRNRSK